MAETPLAKAQMDFAAGLFGLFMLFLHAGDTSRLTGEATSAIRVELLFDAPRPSPHYVHECFLSRAIVDGEKVGTNLRTRRACNLNDQLIGVPTPTVTMSRAYCDVGLMWNQAEHPVSVEAKAEIYARMARVDEFFAALNNGIAIDPPTVGSGRPAEAAHSRSPRAPAGGGESTLPTAYAILPIGCVNAGDERTYINGSLFGTERAELFAASWSFQVDGVDRVQMNLPGAMDADPHKGPPVAAVLVNGEVLPWIDGGTKVGSERFSPRKEWDYEQPCERSVRSENPELTIVVRSC